MYILAQYKMCPKMYLKVTTCTHQISSCHVLPVPIKSRGEPTCGSSYIVFSKCGQHILRASVTRVVCARSIPTTQIPKYLYSLI